MRLTSFILSISLAATPVLAQESTGGVADDGDEVVEDNVSDGSVVAVAAVAGVAALIAVALGGSGGGGGGVNPPPSTTD